MTHGLRGITRAACVLAVLAAGAGPARADDALAGRDCLKDPRGNELQLFIENDSFGATDQYYTHGLKLGVGVRGECLYNLFRKPSDELLRRIREIGGAEIGKASNFGLFIGQNLYTPRDITIAAPQPFDRPWAALTAPTSSGPEPERVRHLKSPPPSRPQGRQQAFLRRSICGP